MNNYVIMPNFAVKLYSFKECYREHFETNNFIFLHKSNDVIDVSEDHKKWKTKRALNYIDEIVFSKEHFYTLETDDEALLIMEVLDE